MTTATAEINMAAINWTLTMRCMEMSIVDSRTRYLSLAWLTQAKKDHT